MVSGPLEIWDHTDDWSGVTSAPERRRRQNRLHQRAHRTKKRLAKFPQTQNQSSSEAEVVHEEDAPCRLQDGSGSGSQLPPMVLAEIINSASFMLLAGRCESLNEAAQVVLRKAYEKWSLDQPATRNLPLVTRITTFDALVRNALVLQIPLEYLETDDHDSLFIAPRAGEEPSLPMQLRPTTLQRAVSHHSWLDLFPIPGIRDNILRGIRDGRYDEDRLCNALCCDMLSVDGDTKAPIIVWRESWDGSGWEFSVDFFAKWGILLQGCPEVLRASNFWRQKRGEGRLEIELAALMPASSE